MGGTGMLRLTINFFERHCGLLLLVFLLPILTLTLAFSSSQAQSTCGAIRPGSWTTVVSGEIQPGSGRSQESPEFTDGHIELLDDCAETFVLYGGGASFTFVRSDKSNFGSLVYSYISPDYTIRLDVDTPERMQGVSLSMAGVSRRFELAYHGETARAPECDCPGLDNFLAERMAESRAMQALYRNPTYWERPSGWPPPPTGEFETDSLWNGNVYDRVIDAIASGQSYRDAIAALDPRVERTVDLSRPQTEAEAGTRFAGGTNAESCQITLGDAHLDSCFPRIEREQTRVHEGAHEAVCLSRRTSLDARYVEFVFEPTNKGLDEVAAYQADMDFISTWKSQNCN